MKYLRDFLRQSPLCFVWICYGSFVRVENKSNKCFTSVVNPSEIRHDNRANPKMDLNDYWLREKSDEFTWFCDVKVTNTEANLLRNCLSKQMFHPWYSKQWTEHHLNIPDTCVQDKHIHTRLIVNYSFALSLSFLRVSSSERTQADATCMLLLLAFSSRIHYRQFFVSSCFL